MFSLVICVPSANAEDWSGQYQPITTPNAVVPKSSCYVGHGLDGWVDCRYADYQKNMVFSPRRIPDVKKGDIVGFVWKMHESLVAKDLTYTGFVQFVGFTNNDATLLKTTESTAFYRANVDSPTIPDLLYIPPGRALHISAYRIRYPKAKTMAEVQKQQEDNAIDKFESSKGHIEGKSSQMNEIAGSGVNKIGDGVKNLLTTSPQSPLLHGQFHGVFLSFDFTHLPAPPAWLIALESIPLAYISLRCFAKMIKTIPQLVQAWRDRTMSLSMCFDFLGV